MVIIPTDQAHKPGIEETQPATPGNPDDELKLASNIPLPIKRWHRWGGGERETGWRVKVTESMANRAAPAVVQPRLVRRWFVSVAGHGVYAGG